MKVRLLSNEESAANATDATIKMLPGGGRLRRRESGKVAFDNEGYATIEGGNEGFLRFALVRQGYVREVADAE